MTFESFESLEILPLNGLECINESTVCNGDNQDCAYFRNNATNFITDRHIYVVFGVNHHLLSPPQSVYNSVGFYKLSATFPTHSSFYGLSNFEYGNQTAVFFEPNLQNIGLFFAIAFTRSGNCVQELIDNNVPCFGFTEKEIGNKDPFALVGRVYLNPQTKTGPAYQQVIPDSILKFKS